MPSLLKVKVQYLTPWEYAPTITYSSQNPVSDSNGGANLIITIRGAKKTYGGRYIDHFAMEFDKANGRYATEIEVYQYREYTIIDKHTELLSSATETNADYTFAWHSDAPSPIYDEGYEKSDDEYFIEVHIKKWSAPNANIIIDSVTGEFEVEYTKTKIREVSRDYKSKSDFGQPSFGVISQGAKCRVVDYDESILSLSRVNALEEGLKVTYTLGSKKIGEFVTANWDYNVETHEVTMNLNDHLFALQNAEPISTSPIEMASTYALIGGGVPEGFETLLDEINKIASICGITINYSEQFAKYASTIYDDAGTFNQHYYSWLDRTVDRWQVLKNFCVSFHLQAYEGTDGITIDREYIHKNDTPIPIYAHKITGNIKSSPINENKYTNVRWTLHGETTASTLNSDPTNIYDMDASYIDEDLKIVGSSGLASPLHTTLANDIYNRYRRGVETMQLTVIVPSESDFIELGTVVKPLKRNGTPIVNKNFIVVDAAYSYDGTHQQKLKLEQI